MKTFRVESKDLYTCWKALRHSERIFKDAILRQDFPNGSNKNEFEGYLADIQETKEKIEHILNLKTHVEVH